MEPALPIPSSPPGPRGLPIIGNLLPMMKDFPGTLLRMRQEYGTIVQFRIMHHQMWLLSEPEWIGEILLGQHRVMHKDEIYKKLTLLGKGLVTSEDELWKRQRRIASKPFSAKQVDGYAAQMREIAERHLPAASGERDVYADMNALTEDIVLEVLFGVPADSTGPRVGALITLWMEHFGSEDSGIHRILPPWVPTPGRRRARLAEEELNDVVFRIIEQKRAQGDTGAHDMLTRLIAAANADDEAGGMSDRQLRDEAVTLYLAGHETTALALTWTLRQLALHPEWQDRVRAELRDALPHGFTSAADARKLPITTAALNESMRLHPPAWAIGRAPTEPCVIAGRPCAPPTQLMVSQYVMHRDPRWFPDPEAWNPQRWLDGLEEQLPRFVYLPFGGGPRVCIGNHFAMLEAVVCLAAILADRRVLPVGDMSLKLIPSVTLRPAHPVRLRYEAVPR